MSLPSTLRPKLARLVVLLAATTAGTACVVPDDLLTDKPCDCIDGWRCEDGVCVPGQAQDGGAQASDLGEVDASDPDGGCVDGDGDGVCADRDCDDTDREVHPGADEVCTDSLGNAPPRDEDCDGSIDDGCPWYVGMPHPITIAHVVPGPHWFPRLSADGLSLYFGERQVNRADRPSVDAPFGPAGRAPSFDWEGRVSVISISEDGLLALAQGDGITISERASTETPFPEPGVFTTENVTHPFVSADGLEVYFSDLRGSFPVLARTRRDTRDDDFGFIAPFGISGATARDNAPMLTRDGLDLFFVRHVGSAGAPGRLMVAHRDTPDGSFGVPVHVDSLIDDEVDGVFVSPETRELFYTSFQEAGPADGGSLFRARICRDGPCPALQIDCPDGVRSADQLRCYTYVDTPATWSDAQAVCESRGGHLASIHWDAELEIVSSAGGAGPYWIGLVDRSAEGFTWSSGEPVIRTYWSSTEPSSAANDDCVRMLSEWDAVACDTPLPYVCETELWP